MTKLDSITDEAREQSPDGCSIKKLTEGKQGTSEKAERFLWGLT